MYREMKLFGVAMDPLSPRPIVLLKGNDNLTVPLWISTSEAVAMTAELVCREIAAGNGRKDLLTLLLERLDTRISAVTIDSLNDGISVAVRLLRDGKEIAVDVRTGEGLATALKLKLPILVSDEVVARASVHVMSDPAVARENDSRRFTDFLESLDPIQLGKYPM